MTQAPQGATRPRSAASPGSRACRGLSEFLDPYLNTTAGSLDGSLRSPSRCTGRGGFEPRPLAPSGRSWSTSNPSLTFSSRSRSFATASRAEGDLNQRKTVASLRSALRLPGFKSQCRLVTHVKASRPRCRSALLAAGSSQKRAEGDLNPTARLASLVSRDSNPVPIRSSRGVEQASLPLGTARR